MSDPNENEAPRSSSMKAVLPVPVNVFRHEYWKKRPLLMRGALTSASDLIPPADIVSMASDRRTPSRLFRRSNGRLVVTHGPFRAPLELSTTNAEALLVQSVETVDERGWALIDAFDFMPRTSVDDLMVSYATAGGGIGAHFDLYDVFLVQGVGRRRWRFGSLPRFDLTDEMASRELSNIEFDNDVVVEPGDVLYLPPRVVHDGIALTECTTYSVGGAGLTHEALLFEYLAFTEQTASPNGMCPGELDDVEGGRAAVPEGLINDAEKYLREVLLDRKTLSAFLGRLLSAPKPHTSNDGERDQRRQKVAPTGTLETTEYVLSARSKILYDAAGGFYLDGEAFDVGRIDAAFMRQLADERRISSNTALTKSQRRLVEELVRKGFVDRATSSAVPRRR